MKTSPHWIVYDQVNTDMHSGLKICIRLCQHEDLRLLSCLTYLKVFWVSLILNIVMHILEHAIIEDICRLLDEANRIMHDELTAQLENVVVTESEECSLAVKVSKTFSDSANCETFLFCKSSFKSFRCVQKFGMKFYFHTAVFWPNPNAPPPKKTFISPNLDVLVLLEYSSNIINCQKWRNMPVNFKQIE